MRKGADCLSKWVGESERQLRLLFDQVNLLCTRDYLLSIVRFRKSMKLWPVINVSFVAMLNIPLIYFNRLISNLNKPIVAGTP